MVILDLVKNLMAHKVGKWTRLEAAQYRNQEEEQWRTSSSWLLGKTSRNKSRYQTEKQSAVIVIELQQQGISIYYM